MHLERWLYDADRVEFGAATALTDHTLVIDKDALTAIACASQAVARVDVALAHPGERLRLAHVRDAIGVMSKSAGRSCAYPGVLGPARTAGDGRNHYLRGVNVLTAGHFLHPSGGTNAVHDGVIDMWGAAARYCVYSQTPNVVLTFEQSPESSNEEFDEAVRLGGLRAGKHLADEIISSGIEPSERRTLSLPPVSGDLPRVVYVAQMQDQNVLRRTYLYGQTIREIVPTMLHPNELTDGAVVSGNHHMHMKVSTQLRCEDAMLDELRSLHGRELNFLGVIVSRGHQGSQMLKERQAEYVAKLARLVGAEGVVLALEGSGNAYIDYMLTLKACEQAGLRTVAVVHELAGPEGVDEPIVDIVPEADALVSVGNNQLPLHLDAPDRLIGPPDDVLDSYTRLQDPRGQMDIHVDDVFCSLQSMGPMGLSSEEV